VTERSTDRWLERLRSTKAPEDGPKRGATPDRLVGWAGVVVAIIAFLITIPPFTVRTWVPTLLLALIAAALGGQCLRMGGEKRLGWATIVAAALAFFLGWAATQSGITNLEAVVSWGALLAATLRYATPLLLAGLGGLVSERSGVVNLALEGMMLMGAFFGAYGAAKSGSWVVGVIVAVAAGMALALVHAIFSVSLRSDQIVSGTALNFIALGLTGYLYVQLFGGQGTPPGLDSVPDLRLPIENVTFVGDALHKQNLLVWIALVSVPIVWLVIFRTAGGLRLRSVGENPRAAETVGVRVLTTRYVAVIASGGLAALGGAFLSIGFVHSFSPNMTAGKGFIALAALIFGRWKPMGVLGATLLFGASSAVAQRLPAFSEQAATLFQALPYVLTLIAVAGLVGRSTPPAADGIPYRREAA
jgi:simple sugar transport system permease protein